MSPRPLQAQVVVHLTLCSYCSPQILFLGLMSLALCICRLVSWQRIRRDLFRFLKLFLTTSPFFFVFCPLKSSDFISFKLQVLFPHLSEISVFFLGCPFMQHKQKKGHSRIFVSFLSEITDLHCPISANNISCIFTAGSLALYQLLHHNCKQMCKILIFLKIFITFVILLRVWLHYKECQLIF